MKDYIIGLILVVGVFLAIPWVVSGLLFWAQVYYKYMNYVVFPPGG